LRLSGFPGNCSHKEFPISFGIDSITSYIPKWNAILVELRGVEIALDFVNLLLDQLEAQLSIAVKIVEQIVRVFLVVFGLGMLRAGVVVDSELIPLLDIIVCNVGVVDPVCCVSCAVGNLGHGFDADNTLECEVGVVNERP